MIYYETAAAAAAGHSAVHLIPLAVVALVLGFATGIFVRVRRAAAGKRRS